MAADACRDEEARTLRSAWQPLFYTSSLEKFVGLMHQAADRAAQRIMLSAGSHKPVNMAPVLAGMTLEVVAAAALG